MASRPLPVLASDLATSTSCWLFMCIGPELPLTGFPHDLRLADLAVSSDPAIGCVIAFSVLLVRNPFPIANLGHVLAVLIDVVLMLDELIPKRLLQVSAPSTQVRQPIDHVHHQVKSIEVILHAHIERRSDRAFFFVAADVEVSVSAPVGQPVDQPRIAMKAENDV